VNRWKLAAAITLGLIIAGAGGYFIGVRTERTASQSAVDDALSSKTLVVIRLNVQLLTAMRQKQQLDLVNDVELWTVLQLSQIDPANYTKGSVADSLYPDTLALVKAY